MHLNNRVMLHGRQLRIIKSKHQHVQMPKDGQEGANLTQGTFLYFITTRWRHHHVSQLVTTQGRHLADKI